MFWGCRRAPGLMGTLWMRVTAVQVPRSWTRGASYGARAGATGNWRVEWSGMSVQHTGRRSLAVIPPRGAQGRDGPGASLGYPNVHGLHGNSPCAWAKDVALIGHSKQDRLTTMPGRTLDHCSPLSADECVARLYQLFAQPGRFPSGLDRPLIGRVHRSGIRVARNHGLWSGRQVVYELSGTLNATQRNEQPGTRLVGRFRAD